MNERSNEKYEAFTNLVGSLKLVSAKLGIKAEFTEAIMGVGDSGVVMDGTYNGRRIGWSYFFPMERWEPEFRLIPRRFEFEMSTFLARENAKETAK